MKLLKTGSCNVPNSERSVEALASVPKAACWFPAVRELLHRATGRIATYNFKTVDELNYHKKTCNSTHT